MLKPNFKHLALFFPLLQKLHKASHSHSPRYANTALTFICPGILHKPPMARMPVHLAKSQRRSLCKRHRKLDALQPSPCWLASSVNWGIWIG